MTPPWARLESLIRGDDGYVAHLSVEPWAQPFFGLGLMPPTEEYGGWVNPLFVPEVISGVTQ